jgi:hypothetical protein
MMYEEDIEEAAQKCIEVLGPVGKYEYPTPESLVNVVLMTHEHGKLWYGV